MGRLLLLAALLTGCDPTNEIVVPAPPDADRDTVVDDEDNCPEVANPDQRDVDEDGHGDVCDNCPEVANPDQADAEDDGIGDLCVCDTCGETEWCREHPARAPECVSECAPVARCGDACCPAGSRCDDGECLLPDLWVSAEHLADSVAIDSEYFGEDACEVQSGCVLGSGERRLLRFGTQTPNTGDGDLHVGNPESHELFTYDTCSDDWLFDGYADYTLFDADSNVVSTGHKEAFCLMDYARWEDDAPNGKYHCGFQGITAGWSDIYSSYLDCQWVDITGVPAGDYTLRVEVNPVLAIAETDFDNNVVEVGVTIPE